MAAGSEVAHANKPLYVVIDAAVGVSIFTENASTHARTHARTLHIRFREVKTEVVSSLKHNGYNINI